MSGEKEKLLRSTEKSGEKQNVSDSFGCFCSEKKRGIDPGSFNINLINKKSIWISLIFFPTIITMASALLMPIDIGDGRIPSVVMVTDWLVSFIPSMRGHIESSNAPKVAAIFYTLSWLLFPVQCAVWLIGEKYFANYEFLEAKYGESLLSRFKVMLYAFLFFTFSFLAIFYIHRDPSIFFGIGINESRFGLAVLGSLAGSPHSD